jgi:ATP-grasp domain
VARRPSATARPAGSTGRQPVAVLLNPYQPYALRFIDRLWSRGIRTVALHTGWRERLVIETRTPVPRGPAIAAHLQLRSSRWDQVAAELRSRYDVVGVLPHEEGMVAPLGELATHLGLSWAQPDVLPAFRDKHGLKQRVAQNDPGIRLNAHRLVRSAADARDFVAATGCPRYVLKPNDGSGNRDITFVDRGDLSRVDRLLHVGARPMLMEEFVGGDEYFVNGQSDARGEPLVVSVWRYERRAVNARENVSVKSLRVPTADPAFAVLKAYAERVLRATGLRRSPFHLEAKVDAAGPCLIEVGARLCGLQVAELDSWLHGDRLDLVDVAVHDYISAERASEVALDWRAFDAHAASTVLGVAEQPGRLFRIEGVEQVERMPEFLGWVKEPHLGDTVLATVDVLSTPWVANLGASDDTHLTAAENALRSALRFNGGGEHPITTRERLTIARARADKTWRARPRPYMLRTRPIG